MLPEAEVPANQYIMAHGTKLDNILATAKIMDSRTMLRMDMRFCKMDKTAEQKHSSARLPPGGQWFGAQ